ncbi:MAG: 50S ribosomal protein L11 methyltransferase [Firmicutes bacterium]|nr:50S ribosomal protein L11 methyltransferase [Bacillota bacterium]
MDLWRISVSTTSDAADAVEAVMQACGVLGTEVVDVRDLQRVGQRGFGEWVDPDVLAFPEEGALVSAYIEMRAGEVRPSQDWREALADALDAVRKSGLDHGTLAVSFEPVPTASWEDAWKAHWHAVDISPRIRIVPLWEREAGGSADDGVGSGQGSGPGAAGMTADRIIIFMDPGMAFGTGTHETTALCLRLLEDVVLPGQTRLLDVGTGSGILAIAAAKLGAAKVLGVDLDEAAIGIARANACENDLGPQLANGQMRFAVSNLLSAVSADRLFDVVLANLLAGLVVQAAPAVRAALRPGGVLIASGLVTSQSQEVQRALVETGFVRIAEHRLGDWVALCAYAPESAL